jgi:hypothetical protein
MTGYQISAAVKATDGEAYLAICAEGWHDPRMIAMILDSVPSVPPVDWLPEPGSVFNLEPTDGQT